MPIPLIVYAASVATMTLRSDTKPVAIYVESPKGTLYWGGAGLDGAYILPTMAALRSAGINNVSVGLTNTATRILTGKLNKIGTLVDAVRAGLTIREEDTSEWTLTNGMGTGTQFNLVGYSYGSLLAAQTANFYAKNGVIVNHLVLIASPISADFLSHLRHTAKIHKVSVIDIQGDGIFAGISQLQLMNPSLLQKLAADMADEKGNGHFYYAHTIPDLNRRLALLAKQIKALGVA